jgi:hypothetical protein
MQENKTILWILIVLVVLSGGILRFALATTIGYPYDIDEYERFGQKAIDYGWFGIYTNDGKPLVSYPPLMVWLARTAAWLGGGDKEVAPSDFRTPFAGLMSLCDMGMIVVLLLLGLKRGLKSGLAAASLWAFNPASLYDTGYWIQSNPPLLLAIGLSAALGIWKRWFWAGLLLGIACILKPQPWILMPMLWLWAWHDEGWKAVWRSFVGLMLPLAVVLTGFIAKGTVSGIGSMFTGIYIYMPAVSVNAHNFWWLAQLINGTRFDAETLVFGFINIRFIALAMLLSAMAVVTVLWWRNHRQTKGADGVEMLAIMAMLFFLLGLQQHENHGMATLVLAAVAWAAGRKIGWQVGLISAAVLANCIVFDPSLHLFINNKLPASWTGLHTGEEGVYLIGTITGVLSLANLTLGFWWIKRFLRKEL